MDVLERTRRVVQAQLNVNFDEVTPEAHLNYDLGADSLDVIETVMAVEEEFGLEIEDEIAEKLLTVQQIVDHVTGALA